MASMINEILFPTVLQGFLARPMVKRHVPRQIFKGLEICQAKGIHIAPTNETRIPNCNNTVWTIDNIKTKDIRQALIIENTTSHDREYIREKFDFTEEDMQSVSQNQFTYLRNTFKDIAFRASQYKMIHKLIYTKKLLQICDLVDTNICDRCNTEIEDFKHLIWECEHSASIWKETEKQIRER